MLANKSPPRPPKLPKLSYAILALSFICSIPQVKKVCEIFIKFNIRRSSRRWVDDNGHCQHCRSRGIWRHCRFECFVQSMI